jgi:hypothetical protein
MKKDILTAGVGLVLGAGIMGGIGATDGTLKTVPEPERIVVGDTLKVNGMLCLPRQYEAKIDDFEGWIQTLETRTPGEIQETAEFRAALRERLIEDLNYARTEQGEPE